MARVNTEKMMKDSYKGQEWAFGRTRKIDGQWVIKIYIDGIYSEKFTIRTDCKDTSERTRNGMLYMMHIRNGRSIRDWKPSVK